MHRQPAAATQLSSRISRWQPWLVLCVTFLATFAPCALAQDSDAAVEAAHFTGRITGTDVHIRSGAGTNFYRCGKLNQGDTVEVVAQAGGWSKIVPPPGSFSWIAMQYVALKIDDPDVAVVTGNGVAVYAGSDFVEPMHSTSKQTTLPRGTKVALFDEQKDGYFKIVPPAGSHLWVSSLYVEPVKENQVRTVLPLSVVAVPEANEPTVPVVEPVVPEPEPAVSEQLLAYNVLQEQTVVEVAKPLKEQDYTEIRKGLEGLAANKEDEDVAGYAAHLLKRVEAYELAQSVGKALEQQDEDLSTVQARLAQARREEIAKIKKKSHASFAVVGKFRASSIYRAQVKRFTILDSRGRIICYAEPAPSVADKDFKSFVGKRVGLVGKIKPFPAVNGALVVFTQVVEIPVKGSAPQGIAPPQTGPPTTDPPQTDPPDTGPPSTQP